MAASTLNLTIEQGTDFCACITLQDSGGLPVDLSATGVFYRAEIREYWSSCPIASFSITETVPQSGKAEMRLAASGTAILPYPQCFYDLILIRDGSVSKVFGGQIEVVPGITFYP